MVKFHFRGQSKIFSFFDEIERKKKKKICMFNGTPCSESHYSVLSKAKKAIICVFKFRFGDSVHLIRVLSQTYLYLVCVCVLIVCIH